MCVFEEVIFLSSLCFLSAMRWVSASLCHTLLPLYVVPKCTEPSNHGQNSLKPWAKYFLPPEVVLSDIVTQKWVLKPSSCGLQMVVFTLPNTVRKCTGYLERTREKPTNTGRVNSHTWRPGGRTTYWMCVATICQESASLKANFCTFVSWMWPVSINTECFLSTSPQQNSANEKKLRQKPHSRKLTYSVYQVHIHRNHC
jgi:hypothetical protein